VSSDLRLAAGGIGWNYVGSGAVLGAQVLYTAVTARLISPAEFGAYAAAQALVGLVSYFGLGTLGNALIRHERQARRVTGTALTLSIAAGAAAAVIVFVVASPWGTLWGAPESASISQLFAAVVLLPGLGVIPLALLRRSLDYRRAALIESVSKVAGMGVGIGFAYYLRSPAALVIGQGAAAGLTALAALVAARREVTLAFSSSDARGLLAFTGHVSGQSIVYYGLYNAPSLVISRMFGTAALGVYSRANTLVTLPNFHLWIGVTRTLYPLISRARNDVARLRQLIESTTISTTGVVWPLFAAVAGAAPLVVAIVLGPRFSDAATLLPPILLFGAVNFAYVVAGNPLEVLGFQRIIWWLQLAWVCLLSAALGLSVVLDLSLPLLLWLLAAAQIVIHAAKLRAAARLQLLRLARIARGYGVTAAVSGLFFLVAAGTERATEGLDLLVARAALEAVAVALVASLVAVFLRSTPFGRAVRSGVSLLHDRARTAPPTPAVLEPSHAESTPMTPRP
jgi:O-antigen/teichoic acid export membrane protein